jgi:hypothetical protein
MENYPMDILTIAFVAALGLGILGWVAAIVYAVVKLAGAAGDSALASPSALLDSQPVESWVGNPAEVTKVEKIPVGLTLFESDDGIGHSDNFLPNSSIIHR